MNPQFSVLPHQREFLEDADTRFLALVAGYGSGKTHAFCLKGIMMAWLNAGHKGCLMEPTNAMAADVLIPDFIDLLNEYQIPYSYRASPYPTFQLMFEDGVSTVYIRSAENYKRLAGLNLAWFGVDEADTINKSVAIKMWRLLQSRLRAKDANHIQGFTTSTPEGFNFLWQYFVQDVEEAGREGKTMDDRRIIHARTADNPFLDDDFIPSLIRNYPANLITSYLDGQFTNLNTGTVYYSFDRSLNHSDLTVADCDDVAHRILEPLHIGMDFNVGKCCAIVHVLREKVVDRAMLQTQEKYLNPVNESTLDRIYPVAVDEITDIKNTEAMIDEIKLRYPDWAKREITIYPDASSRAEKTNASTTDLRMLKKAFNVKALTKNPFVKDRVNSMNGMFCNGEDNRRYLVNTHKCPKYTTALETQAYTDAGIPDKEHDQDHPVDAGGYFIWKRFPLKRQNRKLRIVGI